VVVVAVMMAKLKWDILIPPHPPPPPPPQPIGLGGGKDLPGSRMGGGGGGLPDIVDSWCAYAFVRRRYIFRGGGVQKEASFSLFILAH
jgi:hypothetical protein